MREREITTRDLERWLSRRKPSRVVLESCSGSRMAAKWANSHGHDARILPTHLVRSLGVGTRRIKTDKRDARNPALASRRMGEDLPWVHQRGDEAEEAQDLIRARASLVLRGRRLSPATHRTAPPGGRPGAITGSSTTEPRSRPPAASSRRSRTRR